MDNKVKRVTFNHLREAWRKFDENAQFYSDTFPSKGVRYLKVLSRKRDEIEQKVHAYMAVHNHSMENHRVVGADTGRMGPWVRYRWDDSKAT